MAKKTSEPGKIHLQIIEVMKRFPDGISGGQIRHELERQGAAPADLTDLPHRICELDNWFIIEKRTVHQGPGRSGQGISDGHGISLALRAQILYGARGRCQSCRRSIEKDGITLLVQRRVPTPYSGPRSQASLWAVCQGCSAAAEPRDCAGGKIDRRRECRSRGTAADV